MGVDAFIDHGFSNEAFRKNFLLSREFQTSILKSLIPSSTSSLNKENLVKRVIEALDNNHLSPNHVILANIVQSRSWLSFRLGRCHHLPVLSDPGLLLDRFGEEGWYGPIQSPIDSDVNWYVRIKGVSNSSYVGSEGASQIDTKQRIRWGISAEVGANYVALHWDGFSYGLGDSTLRQVQFPYWLYIPQFFDELATHLQAEWVDLDLSTLILHKLWEKYLEQSTTSNYVWQHLRIRAEASGIALNAKSAGVAEIDITGLKALARQLAKTSLEALYESCIPEQLDKVENALLRTLIHEWGTKSYEFCLEREIIEHDQENEATNHQKLEKLIRSHCYFGQKPQSKMPDCFQHLKCFASYGGSREALKFLLAELGLQGQENA